MTPPLDTITRKSLLYRSGLGFFCINHAVGCAHGCRYPCHGFLLSQRYGRVRDYGDWCRPRLVDNAVELLESELRRKRVLPTEVCFCLSTDPFMFGYPEVGELTLELAERLNRAGVACSFLTKGLLPESLASRERFPANNSHGISLVSLDEGFRRTWEPGAAPYASRLAALRKLHEAGCRTLVHIEPYPTPNLVTQDLSMLLEAVAFVDELRFGGWNYNSRVASFPERDSFYASARDLVREFCDERGISSDIW